MPQASHVLAENPTVDIAVLAAEVDELEEYIIAGEVYRTLRVATPAGAHMVQMSGGDLLARLFRLQGEGDRLPVAQRAQVKDLALRAESTTYSLRTRFHGLLQRELKTRIDSLNWFLDDVMGDPKRARAEYPYEIRNRQRIDAIAAELGDDLPAALKSEVHHVDARIRLIVRPAGFMWDESLATLFPRDRFWYLYASP